MTGTEQASRHPLSRSPSSRPPGAAIVFNLRRARECEVKRVLQIVGQGLRPGNMMGLRMMPQGMVPHGDGKASVVISDRSSMARAPHPANCSLHNKPQ